MRVVVAGASGFVGEPLLSLLADAGHQVIGLSRHADPSGGPIDVELKSVDLGDSEQLGQALVGANAAYYLVHSMGSGDDFAKIDLELATQFTQAAQAAGIERIIYQGALGEGDLSPHLASRQAVGRALSANGMPVVELRAAVILGAGSISFEMIRYLTERIPVMVGPRWVRTKTEPIAFTDVLGYLIQALEVPAGVYDIGCGEVTTYQDMMQLYARARGLHPRPMIRVPFLSLKLSGYWVDLITPLDHQITSTLIQSLTSDVTSKDGARTFAAFGIRPLSLSEAMTTAINRQADGVPSSLFGLEEGLSENIYTVRVEQEVQPETVDSIRRDLATVGGDLAWYGWPWAWRARFLLGRLFGEGHPIGRPLSMTIGEKADWWTIEQTDEDSLVLKSADWHTGEGWLGYLINPDGNTLRVAAAFRPKGLPGFLYWFLLKPFHKTVFRAMAKARINRAERMTRAQSGAGAGRAGATT